MAFVLAANFEFTSFRKQKQKYTAHDRFHGNCPYFKIPTKKEPITTLRFTSRLPCHIIKGNMMNKTQNHFQGTILANNNFFSFAVGFHLVKERLINVVDKRSTSKRSTPLIQ